MEFNHFASFSIQSSRVLDWKDLGCSHPAATFFYHSASNLLARGSFLFTSLHGLPCHLGGGLGIDRLVGHGGVGQGLQLLLHAVHLEAALSVGGLGGVDLLGLIGGDVQVSNNLADVVSEAPWQNCVPWVFSTAGSMHLSATEGLGFRSLPVFDRLGLCPQNLLAGDL